MCVASSLGMTVRQEALGGTRRARDRMQHLLAAAVRHDICIYITNISAILKTCACAGPHYVAHTRGRTR